MHCTMQVRRESTLKSIQQPHLVERGSRVHTYRHVASLAFDILIVYSEANACSSLFSIFQVSSLSFLFPPPNRCSISSFFFLSPIPTGLREGTRVWSSLSTFIKYKQFRIFPCSPFVERVFTTSHLGFCQVSNRLTPSSTTIDWSSAARRPLYRNPLCGGGGSNK